MKKILFAATTAKGHINVFHLPYIKMLKDEGHEVDVVTNGDEKVPFVDNDYSISIKRSPFKFDNIKAVKQMVSIMRNKKYDIVICHTPMGGVITRIAANITKTAPVIYMAHGFHFYKSASIINTIIYKSVETFLARWTDGLITINNEDFEAAKKFKLRKGGKVFILNGIGIDIQKIANTNIDKNAKRKELKISDDAFVVLNIGELIERKNQISAIKAISKCSNKNIVLLICGRGEIESKLKKITNDLNLQDRVIFCGFRNDINEILKIADVFLFPSFQEGLPVSVMEAMAAGLPVICSNVRGNRDLIDKNGGYIVEPLDIENMSYYINKLCNDDNIRKEMGNYNKKIVEKYNISNVLVDMKEIYSQFL